MWALSNRTPHAAERTWVRDKDGNHLWVVAVKATFDLDDTGQLHLSAEQEPPLHEPVYLGEPGRSSLRYEAELVAPKPHTDVIINACAHAPGGRPAPSVKVAARIHDVDKMLVAASEARRLGLTPAATVRAVANARETQLINTDALNLGEGLTAAVSKALAPLDGTREAVENIHCDINGDRYRSEEWGFVALRLGTSLRDGAAYHTPVRSCGDVGAATGALNLVMSAQAWRRGYARGPRALVWGSSDAGLRAAALLEEPSPKRGGATRPWVR